LSKVNQDQKKKGARKRVLLAPPVRFALSCYAATEPLAQTHDCYSLRSLLGNQQEGVKISHEKLLPVAACRVLLNTSG
jgi:hypothetical protein